MVQGGWIHASEVRDNDRCLVADCVSEALGTLSRMKPYCFQRARRTLSGRQRGLNPWRAPTMKGVL